MTGVEIAVLIYLAGIIFWVLSDGPSGDTLSLALFWPLVVAAVLLWAFAAVATVILRSLRTRV